MNKKNSGQSYIHSEEWLEILDELNIGAFTVGFDRRILSMNHSAQALMGLREGDVVGRDCREVFFGVPCLINCLIQGDAQQEDAEPDVEVVDETDARHLITRMATPVYGSDGAMIGCLTILQDHSPIVDLINRVQYEERSMKIVLDNLDVGIFTVNRGGLITFFNKAAEKISGYKKDQVLGEPCTTIFEGNDATDICLLKDSIDDGKTRSTANGKMLTTDGITIPVRANYMALRNEKGKIIGGLATFHDLTLVHRLNQAISDRYTFHDMIGKSPVMQKTFEMVAVVAKSDVTILIEGATGTGKDLLAKVIHSAGRRSKKPFVKVNCAAIPENLLESELFGYVRGAFTGAERDKPGRFQLADGGTIFLDEIGDLPQILQATDTIDLAIPRGSKGLIDFVRDNARVPVIETGAGIVHTYVDASADLAKAKAIITNAKVRRPAVCNTLDTLILHRDLLPALPSMMQSLGENYEVDVFADDDAYKALDGHYAASLQHATDEHFGTEFLSLRMSIETVSNLAEALEHIHIYGSKHSEAIVAENPQTIEQFLNSVDAAAVYANTSTAFTDGGQFGMGAEIGISTQKLHARGPMALPELTSYKWIVKGSGQIRT